MPRRCVSAPGIDAVDADELSNATAWVPRELTGSRAPTVEQLDDMVTAARDEGFAEGRALGYSDGMAGAQAEIQRLRVICHSLQRPLAELEDDVRDQLLALAVAIARAISRVQLAWDTQALMEVVREALAVAGTERALELRLHPGDVSRVELALEAGGVSTLPRIIGDPELAPGDVRVHGDVLRLDATVDTRLAGIAAALAGRARDG